MNEQFDPIRFEKLKQNTKEFYQNLKPIKSPALGEDVNFTADGFHHLMFDNNRSERSKKEQKNKFRCLKEAVNIISKSTTIQEYRLGLQAIGKVGLDGFKKTAKVEYYGFTSVLSLNGNLKRITVVVRRVGNGQLHFWSVMPKWINVKIGGELHHKIFTDKNILD